MEALTSTLLGYPISLLANVTHDQLKKIKVGISDLTAVEQLYLKSFYKAIKEHKKHYDDYSAKVLKKVSKKVKKDEKKFLKSISQDGDIFLSSFNRKEFHILVADKLINNYSIEVANYPNLIPNLIADCFSYYVSSFYNLMNEKQGIQAVLTECLKLDSILNLLNKIDQQAITKTEFDNLRKIVFTNYVDDNPEYKKSVQEYDSYIKNKFKYIELRGFSPKISGKEVQMELDDIFVPLAIDKQSKIVPNIFESSENDSKTTLKSIEILNHRALVILGDPGSGKSTLQKYLATEIAGLRKSEHVLKNIIPVFFRLADFSDFYKKNRKSIYEFITNHLDNQYQHIYKENFEYSNMLILMDGLDEITETPLRLKVTEQVMDLIARYPNNRYIVTSRVVGYQESKLGGTFVHYKLMPFTKEEIKIFTNQWYKSIASNTDKNFEHAQEQADSLYNSISRNPSVLKLATNPLLMTIISMIHYQGKKLPSKRVELYEISTETFLEHWVQLRITDEKQLKDKAEIIEIIAPIAFEIHKTKSNALIEETEFEQQFLKYFRNIHTNTSEAEAKQTCKEFIKFLRQQTGFFYEKGIDDDGNRFYGFMHLTFEEYLAAIEFVSKWSEGEIELEDYIFQPRWTEIIRLAASQIRLSFKGKAGRTQTSNFIRDLLNIKDDFKDAYRPLQLACLIISDDVSINDSLQNEIFNGLIEVLSKKQPVSLINSISKLFKEFFLSDKKHYFIDGIRRNLEDKNELLFKNLFTILNKNCEFREVLNLIKENFHQKVVLLELLKSPISWRLQKEEFYKEWANNIILNEELEIESDENYRIISHNIFELIFEDGHPIDPNSKEIIDFLKYIEGASSYNELLRILLNTTLSSIGSGAHPSNHFDEISDKVNHKYINNINFFLKSNNFSVFSQSITQEYRLNDEYGIISISGEKMQHFYWNNNFSIISNNYIVLNDVSKYLKSIRNSYSNYNFKKTTYNVYEIIGPESSLMTYIDSLKSEGLDFFDFQRWANFPFTEIPNNPKRISETIIKNSFHYLGGAKSFFEMGFKVNIDFKKFCILDIPPPVKLLVSIKTSQPYDNKLINNSIDYYNNCNEDLKDGVFEILYNVLNITNTIDN